MSVNRSMDTVHQGLIVSGGKLAGNISSGVLTECVVSLVYKVIRDNATASTDHIFLYVLADQRKIGPY